MTEVVPIELELQDQVQSETVAQQATSATSPVMRLPWKRPDLKVALVSKFSPTREGGVEYFCNLANSVSTLCPAVGIANLDQNAPPVERNSRFNVLRVWKLNSLSYPFRILKTCLRLRPNVVHVNHEYMMYGRPFYGTLMSVLLLLLKIARRPTVLTLHSVVPHESVWNGFFRRYGSQRLAPVKTLFFLAWTRLTLRLSTHIIVHSQASKSILSDQYGYPAGNISVIGHGIEPSITMSRLAAKEFLGIDRRKVVLNFGYIHEKKGIEHLIRAMGEVMRAHPDSLLVIAGGPHVSHAARPNEFREYVEKLTSAVREVRAENNVLLRTEYIPEDLLPIYFSSADVIALPYVEQFGTSGVLARAMASGRAVVATRVNPFFEIIEEGVNGLLVDPACPKQLSDAIVRLLDSTTLRESLGANLKSSARDLWWPDVARMHVEVYSSIAEKNSTLQP
jgi:glycosyltransferase involved in cell wall biosynthesis